MVKQTICSKQQVERYLLNQLSEEEETLFQQHLTHCEMCRSYITEIRALASIVGEKEFYQHKESGRSLSVWMRRYLKYGVSVAACLVILIGLSVYRHLKPSDKDILYPTNIEYQMRASGGNAGVKLIFPDRDSIHIDSNKPIVFKWDSSASFHLKVNFKDSTLFEMKGNGSEYSLPITTFTPYPYIHWTLTVNEQSYSGQIHFPTKN